MVLALLKPIKTSKSLEFQKNVFKLTIPALVFLGHFEESEITVYAF